jgi:protein tyrosine phosphatase (PTP) superfamily phosphohydrolase (DUF442 family)
MDGVPQLLASRAYWAVPGQLMAGAYPGDRNPEKAHAKITALHAAGIRHVVNLMTPDETDHTGQLFPSYAESCDRCGISVANWPIDDTTAPTPTLMRAILDDIERTIADDRPVFVHCWGGRGRTGTVVGCWLIENGFASPSSCVDFIRHRRSRCDDAAKPSPQTAAQSELVASWRPRPDFAKRRGFLVRASDQPRVTLSH